MNNDTTIELKEIALKEAETFIRTFSAHFDYNRDAIFKALLEKPERYIAEYCKMVSVVISAFKSEEKIAVNINNNNYFAFFEEVSQLSKKIDGGSHKLIKNGTTYELEKIN